MLHVPATPEASPPVQLPAVQIVSRREQAAETLPASVARLEPQDLEALATHPNTLLDAAPGIWISRGSGQEHLTAIRSPVLTGAGACGAFLLMEDGIPIRPAGLCNVNNLFELHLEQAAAVEVLRGPGSALHGSNALHGAIDVRMPGIDEQRRELELMVGSDDYRRVDAGLGWRQGRHGVALDLSLQGAGSFRDQESYEQHKFNLRFDQQLEDSRLEHRLAITHLNQETAGFILGLDAYRDPALRRANLNPEAYRNADGLRASSRWLGSVASAWELQATPYLRSSRMRFLQHFLPGKPLEENGQDSAGLQLQWTRNGAWNLDLGLDLEWADLSLSQSQDGLVEIPSPFLQATRPPGRHYDFQVDQWRLALFAQGEYEFAPRWTLGLGLRAETVRYDYDNRLTDGNLRDDGTPCGFGGCLYTRPGDRQDRFNQLAPKFSLAWRGESLGAWLRLSRGFRAPQVTELYRLQAGQTVAELDSLKLDAAELGLRGSRQGWRWEAVAYYQKKRNVIFRDADGFNVADGATRHRGLEWSLVGPLGQRWALDLNGSYARHSYAFSRPDAGDPILPGNRVDSAPDWLGRAALEYRVSEGRRLRAEWVHQGGYYLDAANAHSYQGHDLLNLSWRESLSRRWQLEIRLANALNRRYAERADFAFGNFRYFPGQGRSVDLALSYRPDG